MVMCIHYIIGVSVGVMSQPTAIAVIEQESFRERPKPAEITELRLRHLERMPLDAAYPDVAVRLRAIYDGLKNKEQARESHLLVDISGTGSSVIKYFRQVSLSPMQVGITMGHGQTQVEYGNWRVSKIELVGALQGLLHTKKFKIAAGLDLVPTLIEELTNFRPKSPAMNGNDIDAWREGRFDDLVFAVALATWQGEREIASPKPKAPPQQTSRVLMV